jgi:superoxide reductase
MLKFADLLNVDDWKKEKHVPVIDCGDKVKAGEKFEIKLSVGKETAHPNTTDHHIRWALLYFQPEGEKTGYQLANRKFTAHGESTQGPDTGPAHTSHAMTVAATLNKSGTIFAVSYCNIHGLWENSRDITVT